MQIIADLPDSQVLALLRYAEKYGLSSDKAIQQLLQKYFSEEPSQERLPEPAESEPASGNNGADLDVTRVKVEDTEPIANFLGMLAEHNPYGDGLEYQESMRSEWRR